MLRGIASYTNTFTVKQSSNAYFLGNTVQFQSSNVSNVIYFQQEASSEEVGVLVQYNSSFAIASNTIVQAGARVAIFNQSSHVFKLDGLGQTSNLVLFNNSYSFYAASADYTVAAFVIPALMAVQSHVLVSRNQMVGYAANRVGALT